MKLAPRDIHIVFDDTHNRMKLFAGDGTLLYACEARNATVRSGTFGHWGPCPRGRFVLGTPRPKHAPSFGRWFIPVLDPAKGGLLARLKRIGIGIHGGGAGLADPFAPYQGWVKTHGCLRVQNACLEKIAHEVRHCQQAGGTVLLTVSGDAA